MPPHRRREGCAGDGVVRRNHGNICLIQAMQTTHTAVRRLVEDLLRPVEALVGVPVGDVSLGNGKHLGSLARFV